ncbi:GNAT family N-acetyltransferase [Streptomyces sp. NPDC050560]|uniref:GNAT family N-acetyltransferase n=1 Tax=Streptomyces sp. NPDC050560 TaxID=3365630 RepID=UPI00379FDEEF
MRQIDNFYALTGPRVGLRPFTPGDMEEFTTRAAQSTALHHPWLFPPTTADAYARYARALNDDPARHGFLVCALETGGIAGFVNISNVIGGAARSGTLSYGAFAHAARQGLTGEAVRLVVRHAFDRLGLHRLEINAQPANTASVALARGLGFRLEGYSPGFLHIDGAWRDHERWAMTAEMARD